MPRLTVRSFWLNLIGGAILAFGLYNVHSLSGVTEGGVLGLTLLLQHWLHISPAISSFVLDGVCYLIGWRTLGTGFIACSAVACGSFSVFYALCEQFPPLWPGLAAHPLAAALLGALFVGVGVGLSVRAGGASGGDDALAMSLNARFKWPIERVYLASDLAVLLMSASYIPLKKLAFSLLTVVLSGRIIGVISRFSLSKSGEKAA